MEYIESCDLKSRVLLNIVDISITTTTATTTTTTTTITTTTTTDISSDVEQWKHLVLAKEKGT